jgi:hypothetical protein
MGARAEALAKRFEDASQALTDVITRLSEAEWKKTTAAEKWSVGVVAHHVAQGHASIGNLVRLIATGKTLPTLTREMIDQVNAEHARDFAGCTKIETLEMHRRNVALATGIVRGLSDAELDRTAAVLLGTPAMSAQQAIERILINHVNDHLSSIRATVGAK